MQKMGGVDRKRSTITVITPFHNTPPDLFEDTVSSMEKQLFSRNRTEWIIVAHNSDREYLDFLYEKTKDLSYVTVYELRNDKHTASSPRNYALQHVTGTYLTFLDSDDMLTPECLSTIVNGMDETGADLGKYRGERREEDENVTSFLDNRVRFRQTKPLLCMKKGDPELKKLLTMANMMMCCQVIRTDFLKKHRIFFREDIRYEEDVMFNLECLGHASSVAMFPQMIGYVYYMHHGSTMQSGGMTKERLLMICHDLAKQLARGLELGFDMRYLFMGHMKMIADELQKGEWEESLRREIRACFLPYFEQIPLPEPNVKFLSAEEIERISEETERIILGYDLFDDGAGQLRRILRDNKGTELGEEWGFETIKTIGTYQERVPLTDYDLYAPYIELTTRIGESDIFCGEEIKGYALSSGTSGRRKLIPYIASQQEENAAELRKLLSGEGSVFLLIQSIRPEEKYADGTHLDSVTGAALRMLEQELRYESFRLHDPHGAVTSPKDCFFSATGSSSYHKRLLYALLDRNVSRIVAPFPWYLLDLFQYMERQSRSLVEDIREGKTLEGEPYPERADELERIFAEGFETPILPKIWPHLSLVIAAGSGAFRIYKEQLRRYIGDVRFHEGFYAASEGIFADFEEDSAKYRIRNDRNFFEFREVRPDGTVGEIQTIRTVVIGGKYELLVTNAVGFYRYQTGDVIRVTDRKGDRLYFEIAFRKSDVIRTPDGAGAIMPDAIGTAVRKVVKTHRLPAGDYCYTFSEDDRHFELYLEQAGHGKETLSAFDRKALAKEFDELLCRYSSVYQKERAAGLEECILFYLEAETQAAYREVCMMRSHLAPDQLKPVRHIDNPVKRKFFTRFVME